MGRPSESMIEMRTFFSPSSIFSKRMRIARAAEMAIGTCLDFRESIVPIMLRREPVLFAYSQRINMSTFIISKLAFLLRSVNKV